VTKSFHNKASQAEKREVDANDRRVRNALTYLDHTHDDAGGRFARQRPSTVVGADPSVNYPAAAPWTRDAVPPEPPLGTSIDEMIPVGESFEVEQSLSALREVRDGAPPPYAPSTNSPSGDGQRSTGCQPPVDAAPSPPSSRRRKKR
jgi:hypothetical protein